MRRLERITAELAEEQSMCNRLMDEEADIKHQMDAMSRVVVGRGQSMCIDGGRGGQ